MTRRVNYSNGQRVDLFDAMAEAEFANQNLRRLTRQLIIGRDAEKRVLWGFAVTPENPGVSSKVLVKLDQGGGNISSAMGAESYGGGIVDFGQLIGGKDAQGNLDGNAQALVDFIGEPAGVYEVKLKFSYVPAIQDNRAFWNPATDSEFIRATNTRLLPTWEAAITGHADPEWILLAEVNWGGATIDTADITDKRDFALEGPARDELAVEDRWSHADQASATLFGVKDFDRGHDRADAAIIRTGLWQSHRALARQIQDIKGGREADGRFDAYSRPYQPVGFAGVKPDEQTKNFRNVDVTTFTVGDGDTDFGDFNGLSGIFDCFQFIEANQAALPSFIRIVVKSRENTSGNPLFAWPDNVTLTDKTVELIGRGNGWVDPPGEYDGLFEGMTSIAFGQALGHVGLSMEGQGGLRLENIAAVAFADNRHLFSVDESGSFTAKNCYLGGEPNINGFALRCPSERCSIENSIIHGRAYIGGKTRQDLFNVFYDSTHAGGLIRNTLFINCLLKLRWNVTVNDVDGEFLLANRLRFQNCDFLVRGSGFFTPHAFGMIDARGAKNIKFDQCNFQYSGDEDCVRIGSFEFYPASLIWGRTQNIAFNDCQFLLREDATHIGWVGGAGGVNGNEGTGWAIKAHPGVTPITDIKQIPRGITIRNCQFQCEEIMLLTKAVSSPDAGAVLLYNTRDVVIENSHIMNWTVPVENSTGDFVRLIGVQTTLTGLTFGGGQNIWIDKNFIGAWRYGGENAGWKAGTLHCIHILGGNQVQVLNNHISAVHKGETTVVDPSTFGAALYISTSTSVRVEENHFILWRSTDDPLHNSCVYIDGINSFLSMNKNEFLGCGGYNIFAVPGANIARSQFNDNIFGVGSDVGAYNGCIYLKCTTEHIHVKDNFWDNTVNVGLIAVHLGNGGRMTIMGNHFWLGNIAHTLATVPVAGLLGWAVPGGMRDFNEVTAYLTVP